MVDELTERLCDESINAVFQALMGTLARITHQHRDKRPNGGWLDAYEDAVASYQKANHPPRDHWPPEVQAPNWSRESVEHSMDALYGALSQLPPDDAVTALGQITASWMMRVPRKLILDHAQLIGEPLMSEVAEEKLQWVMGKWLAYSLEVGR